MTCPICHTRPVYKSILAPVPNSPSQLAWSHYCEVCLPRGGNSTLTILPERLAKFGTTLPRG